jgi:hypothetical protein
MYVFCNIFLQAVALKYGTDNNVAELKEPQNVLFYDMVKSFFESPCKFIHCDCLNCGLPGINCNSSLSGAIFLDSRQGIV